MGRDKVSLFAQIREDHRQLGLGVRALARRHAQDMTDRYDSPDLPHGARYRHEIRVRSI